MVTMPLKVVLGSLNIKKGTDSFYADFMFLGGMISIQVNRGYAERLKTMIGSEFVAVFEMRPRSVCMYEDRPSTVFLPVSLVDLPVSSAATASGLPRMNDQRK